MRSPPPGLKRPETVLLSLVLSALLSMASAEGYSHYTVYPCAHPGTLCAGCPLEKKLVCGDDGFTYQNACLAESQGVKVVQQKPCSDRTKSGEVTAASLLTAANVDTSGAVTTADLNQFETEAFKLIGKVKLVDAPFKTPMVDTSKQPSKRGGPLFATRITPSGLLYFQPAAAAMKALAAVGETAYPPFRPARNDAAPGSRKLLVWGADGRVQVTKRPFPYSAVGQIVGQTGSGGGYSCSGALISHSAIFTAGHCVFDAASYQWSKALNFYPGRLSTTDTTGTYPWVWATTWWNNAYGSCTPSGSCYLDAFRFDFAVVRLAEPVGQTRGYLALKYDNKMQGYSVTSAGYPGDKTFGTMWKTSGTLSPFSGADSGLDDVVNGVVDSDLDIYPGQSGSNVWDSAYNTRALVNAGGSDGRAYHRTVTKTVYNLVMTYSKGANLFEGSKYGGRALSLRPGSYPTLPKGITDNAVSSVSISPGCTATLYDLAKYGGKKVVVTKDTPSLGKFDNLLSSLKLVCKV